MDNYEIVEKLEEYKTQIKDIIWEVKSLIKQTNDEMVSRRAEYYWIPHILGALDNSSGFLGGSFIKMDDIIQEIYNMEDDDEG